MKEAHSEKRQLPGIQPEQTVRSMDSVPASRYRHVSLAGHAYQYFLRILYLSLSGLLTLSVSCRHPDFSGAVSHRGGRVDRISRRTGAARRNGCGIWRGHPVGFPAPEEANCITGYAVNADGGHVHH